MTSYTRTVNPPRYLNDINNNIRASLADYGIKQSFIVLASGAEGKLNTIITYKMEETDLLLTLEALIKILKGKRAVIINKIVSRTFKEEDEMLDARMRNA